MVDFNQAEPLAPPAQASSKFSLCSILNQTSTATSSSAAVSRNRNNLRRPPAFAAAAFLCSALKGKRGEEGRKRGKVGEREKERRRR